MKSIASDKLDENIGNLQLQTFVIKTKEYKMKL